MEQLESENQGEMEMVMARGEECRKGGRREEVSKQARMKRDRNEGRMKRDGEA